MSELLKLKFKPLVEYVEDVGLYSVDVKYFNKYIIGCKFDMRNKEGTGAIVHFKRDYIDVDMYTGGSLGDEEFIDNRLLNDMNVVNQKYLKKYIQYIESTKEKIQEYLSKNKNRKITQKKLHEKWKEQYPFEVTL